MSVRPHLCGLLYCGLPDERHANLGAAGGAALRVYLRNAVTLARSAWAAGHALTLVTNDAERLRAIQRSEGLADIPLELQEAAFTCELPDDVPFRSAHFKIDVLSEMGGARFGSHSVLLDLDMVVLRTFEMPADGLCVQEFSANIVADVGADRLLADLALLGAKDLEASRWYGGGFIGGEASALAQLASRMKAILPRYLSHRETLYHQGDDMLTSAAVCALEADGALVHDATGLDLTGIYWSSRTRSSLAPLADLERRATLHLPADKPWLAKRATNPFVAHQFLEDYRKHAQGERRRAKAKNLVDAMRGQPRQHIPRVA